MSEATIRLYGQIGISVVFIFGYFAILVLVLSGNIRVPSDFKEIAVGLLSILTASVGQIVTTWMRREPTVQ